MAQRGRPKGQQKTGGRRRGQPNKVSTQTREWLQSLLDNNRGVFEADLKKADSWQRLVIMEKLMAFCIPKMASIDATVEVEARINAEYQALKKLLKDAPDDAVEAITQKIKELNKLKNSKNG